MNTLSKKELVKIQNQLKTERRGDTWIGVRPAIFESKKYSKKATRAQSKKMCREYASQNQMSLFQLASMKFLQRKGLESIMYKSDDFLEGFGYVQHHKKADGCESHDYQCQQVDDPARRALLFLLI